MCDRCLPAGATEAAGTCIKSSSPVLPRVCAAHFAIGLGQNWIEGEPVNSTEPLAGLQLKGNCLRTFARERHRPLHPFPFQQRWEEIALGDERRGGGKEGFPLFWGLMNGEMNCENVFPQL